MKPKITLFAEPDCPPCQVLKLFLAGKGVAFEERDIASDPAAAQEPLDSYARHRTRNIDRIRS